MYKCIKCKKEIPEIEDRVRCPYCGHRILAKIRPDKIARVQAR